MENYRLTTRLTSGKREYLLQTANDAQSQSIRSAVFSDGVMIESVEDDFSAELPDADLRELVKSTHKERQAEFEYLFGRLTDVRETEDVSQMDYLGQALTYKRMYEEAESLYLRAVEIDAEAHEPLTHLGQVLMMQSRLQEAASVFERCVELKPKFADYRNNLGEAFLALKSCKRAMIEFNEAVELNLYYGDAYFNKALTYVLNALLREDFQLFSEYNEKAFEMLERAVVICPEFGDQNLTEGRKLLEQGELQPAYDKLLAARDNKKRLRFRDFYAVYMKFLLASDSIDERTLTRRIKTLKDDINNNPHYPDLHFDLAIAYTLLGRFIHSKAIDEYKEALRLNPDFERAKKNLKLAENELKGFDALLRAVTRG